MSKRTGVKTFRERESGVEGVAISKTAGGGILTFVGKLHMNIAAAAMR